MWLLFNRAMIVKPEGIYTGVLNNFGESAFSSECGHRFAFGNNYPPEDPTYAGVRFTYPFLRTHIRGFCALWRKPARFFVHRELSAGRCLRRCAASLGLGDAGVIVWLAANTAPRPL